MIIKIKKLLFLAAFLASCTHSTTSEDTQNQEKQTIENQFIEKVTVSTKTECFRNETGYTDDSDKKDIEELVLKIEYQNENKKVTGVYNWLPAEKDQRRGTFEGILKDDIISANYIFMQEGIQDTVAITILLENNKVTINSIHPENEELGLKTTIAKVDCQE